MIPRNEKCARARQILHDLKPSFADYKRSFNELSDQDSGILKRDLYDLTEHVTELENIFARPLTEVREILTKENLIDHEDINRIFILELKESDLPTITLPTSVLERSKE